MANQCRKEADQARKGAVVPLAEREEGECEAVAVVGTYNLGKLAEVSLGARDCFGTESEG